MTKHPYAKGDTVRLINSHWRFVRHNGQIVGVETDTACTAVVSSVWEDGSLCIAVDKYGTTVSVDASEVELITAAPPLAGYPSTRYRTVPDIELARLWHQDHFWPVANEMARRLTDKETTQ